MIIEDRIKSKIELLNELLKYYKNLLESAQKKLLMILDMNVKDIESEYEDIKKWERALNDCEKEISYIKGEIEMNQIAIDTLKDLTNDTIW